MLSSQSKAELDLDISSDVVNKLCLGVYYTATASTYLVSSTHYPASYKTNYYIITV